MQPLRVLIVDDNFVVRGGLRSSLELAEDIVVVGDAADGLEGVRLAEELLPDVVLTDIRMPGLDGIAVTQRLTERAPSVRVLVLTWSEDVQHLVQAILAGAKGYLVHGTFTPAELTQAVHTVYAGGALITPALAPALLELVREAATRPAGAAAPEAPPSTGLTPREIEVLELVRGGLSNREIAQRLCIEEKTVKNHINNIYSKLQFRSRYEAITARSSPLPA
ncbi:MAG TPA: response regulator transcription factor [Chloroflexota bacterium]|jgi:DNA-binding NarL/FixJ family response regulator